MNPFKKAIQIANKNAKNYEYRVVEFSDKLAKHMQLNQSEIVEAHKNKVKWHVGKYVIVVENRRILDDWRLVLEAIPANYKSLGYSNTTGDNLPEGYEGISAGTCSAIVPNEKLQQEIISEINKLMGGALN